MIRFLALRILDGIVLIFAVTAATATAVFAGGENIARNLAGETATPEAVQATAERLGLDRPAIVQYFDWMTTALTGDFGSSFVSNQPVTTMLMNRLPATLSILVLAVVLTAVGSALLGVLAAVRRGAIDRFVQVFNVVAAAVPNFWVALILVSVFSIQLGIFPATGFVPITDNPVRWFMGLVLPVTALLIGGLGSAAIVRSSVIDVLRLDFVRTLRAHGLSKREVLFRHVLKNAAPPFLTIMSMSVIGLFGGAIIIERVFAINGLGTLANNATQSGDVPVILGVVTLTVIVIVAVNIVLDIVNGWINPKVRVR